MDTPLCSSKQLAAFYKSRAKYEKAAKPPRKITGAARPTLAPISGSPSTSLQMAKQRAAAVAANRSGQFYGYQAPLAGEEDGDDNDDDSNSSNESESESSSVENSDASSSSSNGARLVSIIVADNVISQCSRLDDSPTDMMKPWRPQLHCGRSHGGGKGEVDLLGHRGTRCRWRVVLERGEHEKWLPMNGELLAMYHEIIYILPVSSVCKL